jgi:hypothetical protein
MGYAIGLLEASQARDEQLAVWERNLSLPVPARRRFDWLYRHNPAGPGRLAVLQAEAEGAASATVGTAGYGLRALIVAGTPRTAAVLADLAVDRAHRTALPALMLARALRRDVLERNEVVYAFPNQHAGPILLKLGYPELGVTRRFTLVLRHAQHVRARLSARLGPRWRHLAGQAAGMGLDLASGAIVHGRAAFASRGHRLTFASEIDASLDAGFDRLWQEASGDYPIIGVRDAAFVRWRFIARPEGPFQLALMVAREDGALRGYAALDRVGDIVHIRDLFARKADLRPMLSLVCAALARQDTASISFRLYGAPWLADTLVALGFRERDDHCKILVDSGGGAAGSRDRVGATADWYLTDADEDG